MTSLDDHFLREAPDPTKLVTLWSDATDAALRPGFTALRVVTDTTPWAESKRPRPTFLRGEHLVDRYRLDLAFIEHRALLALDLYAERSGLARMRLQDAPGIAGRLAELLRLQHVRVEVAP